MTTANVSASAVASPTSCAADVLAELDRLIDATPDGHYVCTPIKRSTVVAAAAEIRRLRYQAALLSTREVRP